MLAFALAFSCFIAFTGAKQVCYDNGVGCFSNDPPFDNLPLPEDPDVIAPEFWLLRKGQPMRVVSNPNELNLNNMAVMSHGWAGSYNGSSWVPAIHNNLWEVVPTADVLFINWERGAQLGSGKMIYHQPASNVRVIAKMTAMWLQSRPDFDSTKAHCIGFSLGAHVCGMTAKRMETKWGRISAIDPAGPAFIKDDPVARVDRSDGILVDVMHVSWISLKRAFGHRDFYVNDANIQPGCTARRRRSIIGDTFGCSHYRAAHLYAETILNNPNCVFKFCPCPSQEHFNKGHCRQCDDNSFQYLGYRSIERQIDGAFYGATTDKEPYCL